MTLSDKAKELLDGLAGVTPFKDADLMRYEHGGGRLAILRDDERRLVADFYHEADREHFVRCSPDSLRPILERFLEQEQRIERLEKALEPFVAEAELWPDAADNEPLVEGFPGYSGRLSVGDLREARRSHTRSGE